MIIWDAYHEIGMVEGYCEGWWSKKMKLVLHTQGKPANVSKPANEISWTFHNSDRKDGWYFKSVEGCHAGCHRQCWSITVKFESFWGKDFGGGEHNPVILTKAFFKLLWLLLWMLARKISVLLIATVTQTRHVQFKACMITKTRLSRLHEDWKRSCLLILSKNHAWKYLISTVISI